MSSTSGGDNPATTIELPEKAYFKIGEVAKLLDVEPYVLRYWETEFDVLDPDKTDSGQRVYQRPDIELLVQIQTLLYEEMFTIAGARRQLARKREGKSNYFDLEDRPRPAAGGSATAGDEQLREQLQTARKQLAAAETKLADKNEQLDDHQRRVEQLQHQLDELQADNRRLSEQLEQLQQDRQQPEAVDPEQARQLRGRIAELEEQLQQARRDAEQARNTARERDERKRRLLGSLRSEVESIAQLAESPTTATR